MTLPGARTDRRGRTWWARLVVPLLLTAVVAAACGGGSGGTDDAGAGDAEFDPAGVVSTQFDLTQVGGLDFDPLTRAPGYFVVQEYVYDTLLHRTASGAFEPGLAEEVTILDTRSLRVVLRPNLQFSDGAPLDAEALKFGLLRNARSSSVSFRPEVFEIQDVVVESPTTARLVLKSDVAGAVYAMMAYPETFLVSPKAVADGVDLRTKPVGAGPFVLESFEPEVVARFRKNPNYYAADDVKLGGIDIHHTASGSPSALNGLMSGQLDLVTLELQQIGSVEGTAGIELDISTGNTYGMIYWCKSKPPLDDVRVRRALSLATDREAIVEVVQGGHGSPAWGLWPEGSKLHAKDLDGIYEYDPTRAKQLLAEAGYPNGFSIEAFATPGAPQRAGEVIQAQWKEVGVNMTFVPTNDYVGDFFQRVKVPMWIGGWSGAGNRRITRLYGPGQTPNVCQYDDPELNALSEQLKAVDELSDEGIEIWEKLQEIVVEDVLSMNLAWTPFVQAYHSDRIGGFQAAENANAGMSWDWRTLYVKR